MGLLDYVFIKHLLSFCHVLDSRGNNGEINITSTLECNVEETQMHSPCYRSMSPSGEVTGHMWLSCTWRVAGVT